MKYDGWKVAPGYALIQLDPKIKKAGEFILPEEEKVNRGTVVIVGQADEPFILEGDRVIVGQVRQQIDEDHVLCHVDNLLIKE